MTRSPTTAPRTGLMRRGCATRSTWALWAFACLTTLPAPGAGQSTPSTGEHDPTRTSHDPGDAVVVYLVRHAEKADDGTTDPPLTLAGQIRVQTLRALLADVALTHVHSTDLKRTRDTARPLAEDAGLELSLYDPRDLEGLAETLKATPGRHLVSGHSNTTPDLVAALGGDPSGTIDELEYDRLYVVVLLPGQPALTTLLRFGEPYVEGEDFGLRTEAGPKGPPARVQNPS